MTSSDDEFSDTSGAQGDELQAAVDGVNQSAARNDQSEPDREAVEPMDPLADLVPDD